MKKILLTMGIFCLGLMAKSQTTVLNEVYSDPGTGNSEFFELYNNGVNPAGDNIDCFTLVSFFEEGGNYGVYIVDMPNMVVGPKDYFVAASAHPLNVQGQTGVFADLNWNDPNFRNGSTGGSLQKWVYTGGVWVDQSGTIPANFNDLFQPINGIGAKYTILVFVNGVLNNGLTGGNKDGIIPAALKALPTQLFPLNGACASISINFGTLPIVEGSGQAVGNDNGYIRTRDGLCGSWDKSSAQVNHTPGVTNGSAAGLSGSITTAPELLQCNTAPLTSVVNFSITGVSGDATEAADFPIEIQLYYDFGTIGQLDGADVYQRSKFDATIAEPADTFKILQTQYVILVYKTKRGCFDKVVPIVNGCAPLPVHFTSFTATRNRSTVVLKWETSFEQNSDGFAVERNIKGVWEEIAYVPSQSVNGNSDALLTYTYNDFNTQKGITQYRVRQVDLDGKAKNSEVRAVRGEGSMGNTVVYPNPTSDGKVTVVFEEANVIRDVSVIDMTGRIIKQFKGVSNNNIQIDNLTPGMFTIRIVIPETGEQSVEKIIVNKR